MKPEPTCTAEPVSRSMVKSRVVTGPMSIANSFEVLGRKSIPSGVNPRFPTDVTAPGEARSKPLKFALSTAKPAFPLLISSRSMSRATNSRC